jgi:SNW domain-containing protein 1
MAIRIAADGRNNKTYEINDNFAKFADVMYMTEKQIRKDVEERNRLQESIKMVDTLKKEQELREAAREAKEKKLTMAVSNISSVNTTKTEETEVMLGRKRDVSIDREIQAEKEERDKWRNLRKKEIQREKRQEVKRKGKDEDRDISERIALGQAQPTKKDTMIDSRLYNQTTGLESGFGDDEDYSLYDKPLFTDRTNAQIYRNVKSSSAIDDDGGEFSKNESKKIMEKIHTNKKNFEGADLSKSYNGKPIEFEKTTEEYGLNNIHKKNK